MRGRCALLLLLASMLCGGTTASAQDDPKVGVTMEASTNVGVIWHLFNRLAVKPEVGFSTLTTESERSSSDAKGFTTGVSGRLYLHTWDNLRTYASPGYFYSRSTQHGGSSSITLENKDSTYSIAASFGAQYAFHKKFAVFGETGVSRLHTTFTSVPSVGFVGSSRSVTTGWRSRSGVGAIFYFW
jgi:hypothetical protein